MSRSAICKYVYVWIYHFDSIHVDVIMSRSTNTWTCIYIQIDRLHYIQDVLCHTAHICEYVYMWIYHSIHVDVLCHAAGCYHVMRHRHVNVNIYINISPVLHVDVLYHAAQICKYVYVWINHSNSMHVDVIMTRGTNISMYIYVNIPPRLHTCGRIVSRSAKMRISIDVNF